MKRIQRLRKGCRWIVILVLLLVSLGCLLLCGLVVRAHVASAAAQPWDVLLVLDHSDSMGEAGKAGSDPEQRRLEAASLFITYLGMESESTPHRMGLIHFGTESHLVKALTPLHQPQQREALRRALATSTLMGWTDPLKALELAYDELFTSERHDPTHRQAVILLTDGKPDLPTLRTPTDKAAYVDALRRLVERFREQGCPVFTIAVSRAAVEADPDMLTFYRNVWQELAALTPPAAYYELETIQDVAEVYHAIAAQFLGVAPQPPTIVADVAGEQREILHVPPGLARLKFVIFKHDPAIRVTLFRPGGARLRADDADVQRLGDATTHDEVWAIEQPREGAWTVTLAGKGTVWVWQETAPLSSSEAAPAYTMTLDMPTYVFTEMSLQARCALSDTNGERLIDPSLQVTAELRRAAFPEMTLLAHTTGPGLYEIEHSPAQPGAYTLLVRVLRAGEEVARQERAFEVLAVPRLRVIAPTSRARFPVAHPFTVAARIDAGAGALGTAPLSGVAHITATLADPTGVTQAFALLRDDNATWVATPTLPAQPGPYRLHLALRGMAEGMPFDEQQTLSLWGSAPYRPSLPVLDDDEAAAAWRWPALAALTGVLGAGGGAMMLARQRRPILAGQWRVLHAPDREAGYTLALPASRSAVSLGECLGLDQAVAKLQPNRDAGEALETWLVPQPDGGTSALRCNGQPLTTPHRLQDGDVIEVGGYRLRYENVQQAVVRRSRVVMGGRRG